MPPFLLVIIMREKMNSLQAAWILACRAYPKKIVKLTIESEKI